MAREAGIRLREDELKSQFNGLVDLLLDPADPTVQQGMRRVGVIGFSNNAQLLVAPTNTKRPLPLQPRVRAFIPRAQHPSAQSPRP